MIEISPDGDIVWELNNEDDLGFEIWYPVGSHVLKNGNVVVVNSDYHHREGTKNEVQAFEITRPAHRQSKTLPGWKQGV